MEYIAYRDMLGEQQAFAANRQNGTLWVDLYRDALAVLTSEGYRAQTRLTIGQWLCSMRGRRVFAFCSLRDPMVALAMISRVLNMHLIQRLKFWR